MDRNKSPFELRKIAQVSTNKVGIATYMDAFDDPLEKVRFQAVEYATGKTIQAYIDFGDFLRIADDIKTGRLFRKMDETKQQETLSMGGSVNSSEYNGEPESRIISLGKMNDIVDFPFQSDTAGKGLSCLRPHGGVVLQSHHLRQIAYSGVGGYGHRACGGFLLAAEYFEECGLACAIFAHKGNAVALIDHKTDVVEQWLCAKFNRDVLY